ncbi:MAG: DUF262 domain-containing protein [Streptococcaceae bacterium]|nr:DUF262 domain-containing protein [Streptococcaceae bacterium]MCL2681047.1 DUF262 domain-containing protein [Streptococcaceae bacterium]MCL2858277.1 DUF262 domain-containing protein [Streptococcaceae bacterium]
MIKDFKFSEQTENAKLEAKYIDTEQELEETVVTEDRKLSTDETSPDIETIMNRIDREDIALHPEYQRNYVWTIPQASKFIESLFINIPIAPIFTNENIDGTQEVIDGQQRLTTIYKFYKSQLELRGLSYFQGLNGKTFHTLSKTEQRTFLSKSLSLVRINKESSRDIKFDVFTRINQGGTPLTNQELRRVMYRGEYINFLDKIIDIKNNQYANFNDIFENKDYLTKNLTNQEIALRLISISSMIDSELTVSSEYRGDLQKLYNQYLDENRNNQEIIEKADSEFLGVMQKLAEILPISMERFASYDGEKFSNRINKSVAEFEYLLVREMITRNINNSDNEKIKQLLQEVLAENEDDCFGRRSPNRNMLELRLEKIKNIIESLEG